MPSVPDLTIPATDLQNFDTASRKEWLVTNGLGSYAMGALTNGCTRRYHGLLVAATKPPTQRMVLLSRLEMTIIAGERTYHLDCNAYPNAIYPTGCRFLVEYRNRPGPTFCYQLDQLGQLEELIFMIHQRQATYIRFRWNGATGARLQIRPLFAWKDYHTERRAADGFPAEASWRGDQLLLRDADELPLHLFADGATYFSDPVWYYNHLHPRETERGLDDHEDLFTPGYLEFDLLSDNPIYLIASLEDDPPPLPGALNKLRARQEQTIKANSSNDETIHQLMLASDTFVVERSAQSSINLVGRSTIIAGYPWFTDWGRDTMISLPGLCLATGRHRIAIEILSSYAQLVSKGMLPNRFPDVGEIPEYNTVDASLWYLNAIGLVAELTENLDWLTDEIYHAAVAILNGYRNGTRYNIHADTDGLIYAGEEGVQLTWMDAKVGDWVVTPRIGKPVEIAALWYHGLIVMAEIQERRGVSSKAYRTLADDVKASFRERFLRPDGLGLYDVVDGPGGIDIEVDGVIRKVDPSIRPNQIFAVSLPHSPLNPDEQKMVVDMVQRELLTPFGLRTLARSDPKYQGRYEGDQNNRDRAYHQGTVWPWLLGPFVDAHFRVYGDRGARRSFLEPIIAELNSYGIGFLPEIYDGDPPQRPNGCIAQAWSVAEVLRVWQKVRV